MAIKLKVQNTSAVRLNVGTADGVRFGVEQGIPIYPVPYTRTYTVTPSAEEQTLETAGLMMTSNVKVNPIPSNYGLITYSGNIITVS